MTKAYGQSEDSLARVPLLIDCDTGRDDALSIWLSLQLQQNLVAVTTSYGNTTLENVTANTSGVLTYAGRDDLPLWKGTPQPLKDHCGFRNVVAPRQQSAGNGLCNIVLPTTRNPKDIKAASPASSYAEGIRQMVGQHGKLDYVVLGPATNFALLCDELGESLPDYINSVTMLGGKIGKLWGAIPTADFNIICDPFAVEKLVSAPIVKRLVTLDTTWEIELPVEKVKCLRPTSKIGEKSKEIIMAYCENFSPDRIFRFHDPSVFLLYNRPEFFEEKRVSVQCDEQDPEFGRLIVSKDQGHWVGICNESAVDRQEMLRAMLDNLGLESDLG